MTRLERPDGVDWELLIINNNSTDDTEIVVEQFKNRLPIRHVFEPKQGLSHARNRAIEESKGEVIIWTDDDVLVDPKWLVEYIKGFKKYPEAAFFGGPIEPWFEVEPPKWIMRNFDLFSTAFACRNKIFKGDTMINIHNRYFPFGANMAVRKSAYSITTYNPNLGRIGRKMIGGEESLFFKKLVNEGYFGWWLPGAKVKHFIPRERITRRYLRDYYRGQGATTAIMAGNAHRNCKLILGVPRWKIRILLSLFFSWIWHVLSNQQDREQIWCRLQENYGEIMEYFSGKHPI